MHWRKCSSGLWATLCTEQREWPQNGTFKARVLFFVSSDTALIKRLHSVISLMTCSGNSLVAAFESFQPHLACIKSRPKYATCVDLMTSRLHNHEMENALNRTCIIKAAWNFSLEIYNFILWFCNYMKNEWCNHCKFHYCNYWRYCRSIFQQIIISF